MERDSSLEDEVAGCSGLDGYSSASGGFLCLDGVTAAWLAVVLTMNGF